MQVLLPHVITWEVPSHEKAGVHRELILFISLLLRITDLCSLVSNALKKVASNLSSSFIFANGGKVSLIIIFFSNGWNNKTITRGYKLLLSQVEGVCTHTSTVTAQQKLLNT